MATMVRPKNYFGIQFGGFEGKSGEFETNCGRKVEIAGVFFHYVDFSTVGFPKI